MYSSRSGGRPSYTVHVHSTVLHVYVFIINHVGFPLCIPMITSVGETVVPNKIAILVRLIMIVWLKQLIWWSLHEFVSAFAKRFYS